MDIKPLFKLMADKNASDMFFSAGAPVHIKIEGQLHPINRQIFDDSLVQQAAYSLMSEAQIKIFESTMEMNFGFGMHDIGRFRVNVFRQRGSVAMVIRYLKNTVPSLESLGVPSVLQDLVLEKRGLILVVGATGSGKSTTLASLIDYRNSNRAGHILSIEDPIEYVHPHKKSLVNQREVGVDTVSFETALMNAMREAPDVLMIGEIRDAETMRQALMYTQSGHLCMATLHANNSYHALTRIVGMFPMENRTHLLQDLAVGLRAVISQRLVKGKDGKRVAAVEVLLNTLYISELIQKQEIDAIKEAMEQSMSEGSETFERALFNLYQAGKISLDEALLNADSRSNLEWLIKSSGKQSPAERAEAANHKKTKNNFDQITIMPELLE